MSFLINAHRKLIMVKRSTILVCGGISAVSLLLGIVIGWKLFGARKNYLKKQKNYYSAKAEGYEKELLN